MSIITKDLPTQKFNNPIRILKWESDDLHVDLSPMRNIDVMCAEGTFTQIMNLIRMCNVERVRVTGALNNDELSELEKLESIEVMITDICELPPRRLRNVYGEITPKTSQESTINILKTCPKISLVIAKNSKRFDLICEHAHRVISLNLCYTVTDEQLEILIPKMTKLRYIGVSRINQNVINILGQSAIPHINTKYDQITMVNISSIITNPWIKTFTTKLVCYHLPNDIVTLLEFNHPSQDYYPWLRKKCAENKEADFLRRMADIKTPNYV